jgi:hypothetical protein
LADAPLVAWNRTQDGRIAWSAGQIALGNGVVTAAEAAALAVARAQAQVEPPEQSECRDAPGSAERFRLTIAGAENGPAATLDAIETIGAAGARLGIATDASGALSVERSLERFVQTMTETFTHLNVGLAIFDRNQTLAMFNPAWFRSGKLMRPGWRGAPVCAKSSIAFGPTGASPRCRISTNGGGG